MSGAARRAFVRISLALALGAPTALGDPSRWDRIRDPESAKIERALVMAYKARAPRDVPAGAMAELPELDKLLALRAATVLELAGGEALASPGVWYFLGDALVTADRGRDDDGRRMLLRALEAAPDSPLASHAWAQVATASNRLHDFTAEHAAYTEQLRVEWDRNHRADVYVSRGESSMSAGDLRAARSDYQLALSLTDDSESHALASWGLAVALARDDDLPDALRYAGEASRVVFRDVQGNPITALELPSVFFTPAYEIFYYRALGAMAAAESATEPKARKIELEWAMLQWDRYLAEARAHGDRWIANAQHQRKWCERRLEKR
jgi:tetratricopeptide (TPR) repeat protein